MDERTKRQLQTALQIMSGYIRDPNHSDLSDLGFEFKPHDYWQPSADEIRYKCAQVVYDLVVKALAAQESHT